MIDLTKLVADENGLVHLMPTKPTDGSQAEMFEKPEVVTELDFSLCRTEEDKGLLCRKHAEKHDLHFLGFCLSTGEPLFK